MHTKGILFLKNLCWIVLIAFLPSCIKYYKLSKTEFPQGKERPLDRTVLFYDLKSKKVYKQFATMAMFDVLYLSDKVRELYVDLYCKQHEGDKNAILRRQLEENKHWISFYILSYIQDETHKSLADKDSIWSLVLRFAGDKQVSPISIEEVDLSPEIKSFFGYRFSRYKRSYLVKFPSKDSSGKFYLDDNSGFTLVSSAVDREVQFSWDKPPKLEKWKVYEDFYWF